jgi:putative MATE family efflux protein
MSHNYNQHKGKYLLSDKQLSRYKRLWRDIVESVSGTDQDFTEGSLNRAILLLSIPMVLEMMMESLFALFDTIFVARLGSGALATIGYTEGMMTIFYAIGIGFSMATTALVARRIGEHNKKAASRVAAQAITIGMVFSVLLAIPGILYSRELLGLMGASPETVEEGHLYTKYMMSFNIVIMLLFIINAIFRSSGDAAISMKVLFLANLMNIILDPCLIFGLGPFPEMGIKGAAIATIIGRGTAVVVQFYILFRGNGRIHVALSDFKLNLKIILSLIKLSYGGIGQYLIATSSWVILVRILSEFGDDAVAGYQIAIRILVFSILPSWGLSNAAATMVGQNLGAKNPEEQSAQCGEQRTSMWSSCCFLPRCFYTIRAFSSVCLLKIPLWLVWCKSAADHQSGLFLLCIWHGDASGFQRGRRHNYAYLDQPDQLLVCPDTGGLCAVDAFFYE